MLVKKLIQNLFDHFLHVFEFLFLITGGESLGFAKSDKCNGVRRRINEYILWTDLVVDCVRTMHDFQKIKKAAYVLN